MSEFDKLAGEAGKEAKEHPEQVKEGEHVVETGVEKKLGMNSEENKTSQHDQNNPPQDAGGQQGS